MARCQCQGPRAHCKPLASQGEWTGWKLTRRRTEGQRSGEGRKSWGKAWWRACGRAGLSGPRGGSVSSFSQSAATTRASTGAAAWRQRATACAVVPRAMEDASARWVSPGRVGGRSPAPKWGELTESEESGWEPGGRLDHLLAAGSLPSPQTWRPAATKAAGSAIEALLGPRSPTPSVSHGPRRPPTGT